MLTRRSLIATFLLAGVGPALAQAPAPTAPSPS